MPTSMTGYGKYQIEREGRTLTVELKSVNHRFLDLSIKAPKQFAFAEDTIRKSLSAILSRGHVDVFLTYMDNRPLKTTLALNIELAKEYAEFARILSEDLGLTNDFTVASALRQTDVVTETYSEDDEEVLLALIKDGVSGALNALTATRAKEGAAMLKDIASRIDNVQAFLDKIIELAPLAVNAYAEKLRTRLAEAMEQIELDETRLIQEVALFTDKCNVDEEIARLGAHITSFRSIIAENEPIGRKLDFLLQEMNREVNTMGSKANSLEITNTVVALKCELEKIREQVQNLE